MDFRYILSRLYSGDDERSKNDINKLSTPFDEVGNSKKLIAKEFHDAIIDMRIELSLETIDSFKKLFRELTILK